ncbi:MAG: family 20 glycosylhydrolase [Clostridia bacterium]|nr:family 20 glycosylhydrolase [Clostridia bacterium]
MKIENKMNAIGCSKLDLSLVATLWSRFCFGRSELVPVGCDRLTFALGNELPPVLQEGKEYALLVSETGAAVTGRDPGGLMRGIVALLMKIELKEGVLFMAPALEQSRFTVRNRMLHLCVFPENDLYFIKKLVRLAGLCQYTHLVIEFWGMLQYDCLRELAWPNAFTKAQVQELLREVRAWGMEPIPMFNQLGHATACRVIYGKHVVLDQNPALQELFTPDGWAWNIHSPKVHDLLKQIRLELYELYGEGEYLHIGCDEAYYYTRCEEERQKLPDYLRNLTAEVAAEGRRPMIWMDMLLERDRYNKKYKAAATCAPGEVELLQNALHPATVLVDWQYHMPEAPVETLMSLKNNIRDAMGAPWYEPENYTAMVQTVAENGFHGVMMTTWHTLGERMPSVLGCARACGAAEFSWSRFSGLREETATLLRRVSFEGNSYADCGWKKEQIEV